MNAAIFIANRLRLRRRGERGTTAGTVVGVVGVALSAAVMLASIAIVNGFKKEVEAKVCGLNASLTIISTSGNYISLTEPMQQAVADVWPQATVSVVSAFTGLLKTPDNFEGMTFIGLSPQPDTLFLGKNVVAGLLKDVVERPDSTERYSIAISQETASKLDLNVGDRVDAFFVGSSENVRQRRYNVGAIYNTHFVSHDRSTVFVAQAALPLPGDPDADTGTAILVNGIPRTQAEAVSANLYDKLIAAYTDERIAEVPQIVTINRAGEIYFNWLSLLDTNVVVILALMGVVSGFTLVSSLFVIILRRVSLIGTLKALGATNRLVSRIFTILAMRITLVGLAIGDAVGLGLLLTQQHYHFLPLDPDYYYLDTVPIDITPTGVIAVNLGVILLAFIVVVWPSHVITTISPSSTMRYE